MASSRTSRLSHLDDLRGHLRCLFGAQCLYDNYVLCNDEVQAAYSPENLDSSDEAQKIASVYFEHAQGNEVLNENYVNSAIKLISGQSILISNPFYKDLTVYLMLPILRNLLAYRKCLVIVSREAATEDVRDWLDCALEEQCGTRQLWHVEILKNKVSDADVGILRGNDLYHYELQIIHKKFLAEVGFILILEPSHILATGQLGLSILIQRCERPDKKIVYCAMDRNCDGLVDALSHTFKTSITEVTATVSSNGNCSCMYWDADGSYLHHRLDGLSTIAHYLGMGTELNLVALRHRAEHGLQQVYWISSEKFPVVDMKWIAGQYYKKLCAYALLPVSQAAFENAFRFEPNLWFDGRQEGVCLTIEDEFYNLFEITRVYLSRGIKQSFINVISDHYYLRDYMVDNFALFNGDSKAIPTIVPDYARTARNTILKLLIMMSQGAVRKSVILREFDFCDIRIEQTSLEDPVLDKLRTMIQFYCNMNVEIETSYASMTENAEACMYHLKMSADVQRILERLKTAYFFIEDEMADNHYIAARLYGNIYQSYLPGQFVTFEGKYYQVQSITPRNGVILRRAADHIHGRLYYDQMTTHSLESWTPERTISINGIERTMGALTFEVETSGYYEMPAYRDMKNAKKVILEGIPKRRYVNKTALRIQLPDAAGGVLKTICFLLNEIFRTTYPESFQYVRAVVFEHNEVLSGASGAEDYFLILEDSDIDMGLVVSVERNLNRYLEIIADTLLWHQEQMYLMPCISQKALYSWDTSSDDSYVRSTVLTKPKAMKKQEPLSLWARLIAFFKQLFGLEGKVSAASSADDDAVDSPKSEFDLSDEGTEAMPVGMTYYQRYGFLNFGEDSVCACYDIEGTIAYLSRYGFDKNPLQQVRHNLALLEQYGLDYSPKRENVSYCAFCGAEIEDDELLVHLDDQRLMCKHCQSHLIPKEEIDSIFYETRHALENIFKMKIGMPMRIFHASQQAIRAWYRKLDKEEPGAKSDPIRYGFVIHYLGYCTVDTVGDHEVYSVYVETYVPLLNLIQTYVYALVGAWYHVHRSSDLLPHKNVELCGMQRWAEIQFMIFMGKLGYAKRLEVTTLLQRDIYARGFKQLLGQYPLDYSARSHRSPF